MTMNWVHLSGQHLLATFILSLSVSDLGANLALKESSGKTICRKPPQVQSGAYFYLTI